VKSPRVPALGKKRNPPQFLFQAKKRREAMVFRCGEKMADNVGGGGEKNPAGGTLKQDKAEDGWPPGNQDSRVSWDCGACHEGEPEGGKWERQLHVCFNFEEGLLGLTDGGPGGGREKKDWPRGGLVGRRKKDRWC